jgi:hypothetical protein
MACGEDPPYVMAQLGHPDAAFTLRGYAHAMRRDEGDKERLKALVKGRDWAPLGTTSPDEGSERSDDQLPEDDETPADAGVSQRSAPGKTTRHLVRDGSEVARREGREHSGGHLPRRVEHCS